MASPLWRKRALEEFRKSVDLGASGIIFDECFWHMSPYCFSKSHGHAVPGAVFSGDMPLIEGFRTIVDSQDLSSRANPYDIELQTYNMSYFRINHGFIPFGRYIDPFAPMSVAITGWNDLKMVDACMLYRFVMSYEPRDFHGKLDEMPATMSYGRTVDNFRRHIDPGSGTQSFAILLARACLPMAPRWTPTVCSDATTDVALWPLPT